MSRLALAAPRRQCQAMSRPDRSQWRRLRESCAERRKARAARCRATPLRFYPH